MIEIIFDCNAANTFLGEERPVFAVKRSNAAGWSEYRRLAREILSAHENDKIVIVRGTGRGVSVNWLAVALFAESCFRQSRTEAVVFKAENYEEALAAYKPFVALTIGIKYAVRLYQEDLKNMYKDIASLSYLQLSIKEDYLQNKLIVALDRGGKVKKIKAKTAEEALTAIGIVKSLALVSAAATIECELDILRNPDVADVNIDNVIDGIVRWTQPFFDRV